jgi:hypothetical protein
MPKEMDKVNQSLKDNSQIWSSKDLKKYADFVKAQREMQVALTGIYIVIARDVVPWLTKLVQALGWVLQKLRPLSPVLVPLTIALAAFVVVVKSALFIQKAWNLALNVLPARLTRAKVAQQGMNTATRAGTGAMKASIIQLGLYGIAIAAAAVAIYGIVKAYNSWKKAADQAKNATAQAQAALDKNKSKLDPGFVAQKQADINRDAYKDPRLGDWFKSLGQGIFDTYIKPLWGGLWGKKYAAGGDFVTRGATPFVAGEAGPERVTITPLGRSGVRRGASELHIHIGQIMGTDRAAAEKFATMVGDVLQRRVRYANA